MTHLPDTNPTNATPPPLPHEPANRDPYPQCGTCNNTPWPCEERKRQREEIKAIVHYIRTDLYERAPLRAQDRQGARWTSPIGWSVWYTYGEGGIPMTIRDPGGKIWAATTGGTVEWLEENLP